MCFIQYVRNYVYAEDIPVADAPGNLVERTVPYMRLGTGRFANISTGDRAFAPLLSGEGGVTIPAHTTTVVELSAGEEQCSYLLYAFAGGRGARVTTLCSECYCYPQEPEVNEKGELVELSPRSGL